MLVQLCGTVGEINPADLPTRRNLQIWEHMSELREILWVGTQKIVAIGTQRIVDMNSKNYG